MKVVSYDRVAVNGTYLPHLPTTSHYFAVIGNDGKALMDESGSRPHLYRNRQEAEEDILFHKEQPVSAANVGQGNHPVESRGPCPKCDSTYWHRIKEQSMTTAGNIDATKHAALSASYEANSNFKMTTEVVYKHVFGGLYQCVLKHDGKCDVCGFEHSVRNVKSVHVETSLDLAQ